MVERKEYLDQLWAWKSVAVENLYFWNSISRDS